MQIFRIDEINVQDVFLGQIQLVVVYPLYRTFRFSELALQKPRAPEIPIRIGRAARGLGEQNARRRMAFTVSGRLLSQYIDPHQKFLYTDKSFGCGSTWPPRRRC